MSKLSVILRKEMKAQGMKQADLASAIGISQPGIQKILSGVTKKPRVLPDIAEALGVSVNYLLGIEERKETLGEDKNIERVKALFMQLNKKDIEKGIEYMETLAANSNLKKLRGK